MRILVALFLLCACALGEVRPAGADGPDLDDLVVSPALIELAPGEEVDLTVIGHYDDGSTANLTGAVTFESEDDDVVVMIGSTVVAVGDGETEISVEHLPSGVRADDPPQVTVWEILALSIAPSAVTIEVGEDTRLTALADLEGGRTGVDVTGVVDWESNDTDVATVSNGLVTGVSVGESDLSVSDPSSGTESENDAAVVTVEPVPDPNAELLEVTASPEDALAIIGDVIQLSVIGEFDDDTVRDITTDVTYESNRPSVAAVDTVGRVYALAPGVASIRVDHPSGRSASERPEIWVGDLVEIHLNPTAAQLTVGESLPLAAVATYDNGLGSDVTEQVAWSSDAASIAAVSSLAGTRGRVSAVGVGVANVSATHLATGIGSPESEGDITVLAPTPTPGPSPTPTPDYLSQVREIVFVPPVVRLMPGQTQPLQLFALLGDGSMTEITDRAVYKVRAPGIADLVDGEITALKEGHAEVYARDPVSGRRARVNARIEVTRMLRLRVVPAAGTVAIGADTPFTAFADYDDGSTDVDVTAQVSWKIAGAAEVASVDDGASKGLVSGLADGRVVVQVTDPVSGLSSDATTGRLAVGSPAVEDPLELVALRFDPAPLLVPHRGEVAISISGVQADGTVFPVPIEDLRLRSLQRRVAGVRSNGTVRGRRPGIGTLEVTHRATGVSARLPVTVLARNHIVVDPPSAVLMVGESIDLTANATYNDGTGPFDETAFLRWRSLNPSLVAMEEGTPGRAVARREGIAIVEASHRASRVGSDATSGVLHVVTGLVRISVEPSAFALEIAGTQALQAVAHYSDGSVVDVTADVDWFVQDGAVASVDASGLLTATALGDTVVSATHRDTGIASGGFDRAFLAVGRTLIGLQVSRSAALEEDPRRVFLAAGESTSLFGLAVLDAGGPVDRTDDLFWSSSRPAAVSVTQAGIVTCNAVETATIAVIDLATPLTSSATLGDAVVTCGVATVDRLEIRPETSNVDYPAGRNLRAFRVFTNGEEVEVTTGVRWTSGAPEDLGVIESGANAGRVTGLDDGIVTVTARDAGFGLAGEGIVTVRKVRVDLRIFENQPEPDNDGVFRGQVGDLIKLKARVEYASGATQGVNQVVNWSSSNPAVVQMGAAAGLQKNWGRMVGLGTATITATWPADEHSAEQTDSVEFEVQN